VSFFPSDHHFTNEAAFTTYVDLAFAQAEQYTERVFLPGVTPDSPEEVYGWIELGTPLGASSAFEVRGFWEKPFRRVAARLMCEGSLWNSFIMVGRVSAFLEMMRRTLPDLIRSFESMWAASRDGGRCIAQALRQDSRCELFGRGPLCPCFRSVRASRARTWVERSR
jgi:mannose-1-phosphate guanylyltransferase